MEEMGFKVFDGSLSLGRYNLGIFRELKCTNYVMIHCCFSDSTALATQSSSWPTSRKQCKRRKSSKLTTAKNSFKQNCKFAPPS
jgi:hypothetical protein